MTINIKILDQYLSINSLLKDMNILKKIRSYCNRKDVIIIKELFDEKYLNKILRLNKNYFKSHKPFIPQSYNFSLTDFYRIDKNVKKSKIKKNQTIYFYPLHKNVNNEVRNFTKNISLLRNKIAGLRLNYGMINSDRHVGIGVLQHYPNNGFMSEHYDPKLPQRAVVSVILEDDYYEGGLSLKYNNKFINIDKFISKGDVVIHAPDILHKVEKVKSSSKKAFAGRWRASSVLLPVT